MTRKNRLAKESSPYLLQHAGNPVDWFPWGEEALEKAKSENKLILISIGYAACHWCHVMEHESFEDAEVAELMNRSFTCIKVDREERPDIDTIYMTAVQMMTGHGGWPLNCFALPDGKPVYGGTYFRKDDWKRMLSALAETWMNHPEKIHQFAEELTQGILRYESISSDHGESFPDKTELEKITRGLFRYYDHKEGGMNGAPKFPLPVHYLYFLERWMLSGENDSLEIVSKTLDKMALGGIFDQVGGGFARYSVDEKWQVPHFEKMLYDNAQLISLYSKAFLTSGNEFYREIAIQTAEFVIEELLDPAGGFYSSLDADSEGVEGKYYCWSEEELDELLQDKSPVFKRYFGVITTGNWEGTNILHAGQSIPGFAAAENIPEEELRPLLSWCLSKLKTAREGRMKPALDKKIITSWNGLMINALCHLYRANSNRKYLEIAQSCAEFVSGKLWHENQRLFRTYRRGEQQITGFLDDHAHVIEGLIALYEVSASEKWLAMAGEILDVTIQNFYNQENSLFYYTSSREKQIIARTTELADNVIPSSNSVMAFNLYRFGHLMGNTEYISMAESMARQVSRQVVSSPENHMNWLRFVLLLNASFHEVAIVGPEAGKQAESFIFWNNSFHVLSFSENESKLPLLKNRFQPDKTLIYVCRNHQCSLPVEDAATAIGMLHQEM